MGIRRRDARVPHFGQSSRRSRSTRSIAAVASTMSDRFPVFAAVSSHPIARIEVDRVEQHVRGIAQRDQLGAVCKHEGARKLAPDPCEATD